jgi:NAD(P)-dependent dehydrogenase (short-subunit alcohol dehydrogenase family)
MNGQTGSPTVIVTGVSSGIGQAAAEHLRRSGWRVFGTKRRLDPDGQEPDTLKLDVASDESVEAAVAEVLARAGRIDALVNNAGVDMLGAVEETTVQEALRLFQTNFFGVHRMVRAVLPGMRARKAGRLVTIGSVAGFLPTPFEAFYSASKHALEGYCESLDFEVRPFGIHTVLIEPGFIRTQIRSNLTRTAASISAYAEGRERVGNMLDRGVQAGIDPLRVAEVVERALTSAHPKLRMRVGRDAQLLHYVYHHLPSAVFTAGMRQRLG